MKKKRNVLCVAKRVKEEILFNMETNKIRVKQMKEESIPSCL